MTTHILVDKNGYPLNITSTSAKGDERKQVIPLLNTIMKFINRDNFSKVVPILEADKGYDSKHLRTQVLKCNIFPWISYREWKNKKKNGIPLIKSMRWKVERAISWLQRKYRRIAVRYERKMKYWVAFLKFSLINFWMFKLENIGGFM